MTILHRSIHSFYFFLSSRRRHTRCLSDWSSDVCSSDLNLIIEKLLAKSQRTDIPAFHPGDTVRVHVKIKEGDKERVQAFEGVVIKRDNGPQASFTVRKISFGQGVERIFPVHSK